MKGRSAAARLYQWIACLLLISCLFLYACEGDPFPAASAEAAGDNGAPVSGDTANPPTESDDQTLRLPEASGTIVYEGEGVTIDASHTDQGYVMIKSESSAQRLKVSIAADASTYYYDLPDDGAYQTFPLQLGSGAYTVRVMENVEDDLYAVRYGVQLDVQLADENDPFLYPNQYVSFDADSQAVETAHSLAAGLSGEEKIAETFYKFVVRSLAYDGEKAATVQSGYLPDVDETLETGKGICFDYAALLAAMLRAEGIPAKVMIGVVSPEHLYHAWNSVYLNGEWVWMDATLNGTGHRESDYTAEREY